MLEIPGKADHLQLLLRRENHPKSSAKTHQLQTNLPATNLYKQPQPNNQPSQKNQPRKTFRTSEKCDPPPGEAFPVFTFDGVKPVANTWRVTMAVSTSLLLKV